MYESNLREQRYGDFGVNTNNGAISSLVCCDREPDLRQRGGMGFVFVVD